MLLWTVLLAAAAGATETSCWRTVVENGRAAYYEARIASPADNLVVSLRPMHFAKAEELGIVASNGTFFSGSSPLADVLDSEGREYHPYARRLTLPDRVVDLGRRWAVGRPRGKKTLAIVRGDQARETMDLYLGGGAILLLHGQDRSADNAPKGLVPGESFPSDILARRTSRALVGLTASGELLLVGVLARPGATPAQAAAIMKSLGAEDAVMFDGGGAFGFSAGDDVEVLPSNRGENLNPTHLAARACR